VVCSFCGDTHGDSDNYCPRCGRNPKKKAPYSDFELGRIAALDTIKKDFWTWFLSLFAILSILAAVGVNEIIKSKVVDAVANDLQTIQKKTDDASTKALQSSAEADIETRKVDRTLADLEDKQANLQKSLDDTDQRKTILEKSISDLNASKQRMVTATAELEQKENDLKKIIDTEHLTTIFAQLRNDHYRVRTLKARAFYEFSQAPAPTTILFTLNTISLSRGLSNKNPPQEDYVVQFHQDSYPVSLNNASGTPLALLVTYEMYPVFERSVVSRPLTNLNGMSRLSLQFGPSTQMPPLTIDSTMKNLEELVDLTKKLTIEIELNGTIVSRHEFTKEDLRLPTDKSSLVSNGSVTFTVTKEIPGTYNDVRAVYDTIAGAP
jgi:hypothetical protein